MYSKQELQIVNELIIDNINLLYPENMVLYTTWLQVNSFNAYMQDYVNTEVRYLSCFLNDNGTKFYDNILIGYNPNNFADIYCIPRDKILGSYIPSNIKKDILLISKDNNKYIQLQFHNRSKTSEYYTNNKQLGIVIISNVKKVVPMFRKTISIAQNELIDINRLRSEVNQYLSVDIDIYINQLLSIYTLETI